MFVLPAASSIALDVLFLTLFWVERKRDDHLVFGGSSSFQHCMADILVFTGLRLLFLTLFATMFYKERYSGCRSADCLAEGISTLKRLVLSEWKRGKRFCIGVNLQPQYSDTTVVSSRSTATHHVCSMLIHLLQSGLHNCVRVSVHDSHEKLR